MEIIREPERMQETARHWRNQGLKIAFVPTMGYFHAGHLSLMEYGRRQGDRLVVSIFVNPTQFGPQEDLDRYPRDLERDCRLAEEIGVDVVFTPTPEQMYPAGYQTYVTVEEVSRGLCGAFRPNHFRGVATVVLKLFNLVQPHLAIFGEKDYQQLVVIKRMVKDLNLLVEVVGRPLVREADGLAMSSRNVYLSPAERQAALNISRALFKARELVAAGERSVNRLREALAPFFDTQPPLSLDYLTVVHPETLAELQEISGPARLAVAARIGQTRLIDNILLEVN